MQKKIVIIGAGPSGLLLAHYLLRRGKYKIDIYERRSDKYVTDLAKSRTYPMFLYERGRSALRAIPGLEEGVVDLGVFCNGNIFYQQNTKPLRFKNKKSVLTIERNRLIAVLWQKLIAQNDSQQVEVHFGCECVEIDGTTNSVTLQPREGNKFQVNYDILVGADGARSSVREYLRSHEDLQCRKRHVTHSYKSVFLNRINSNLNIDLEPDTLHSSNITSSEGKTVSLAFMPQEENKLHGVIIYNADRNPLGELSTKEEVLEFFKDKFPPFGYLMSESEAESLLTRPEGRALTVNCDRFHHGDNILVIGDAAHATAPAMGQGCTSSLEDAKIIDRLLEQCEDDWAKVLPLFSQQRVPEIDCMHELSNYSAPDNRHKLLEVEFHLRSFISGLLHQWFPRWFQPFVTDLLYYTDIPYSQIFNLNIDWLYKVKKFQAKDSLALHIVSNTNK